VRLLTEHFLDTFRRSNGDRDVALSEKALQVLVRHHWPGNVRELKHVIERAVAMTPDGGLIGEDLLSSRPRRESFRKLYEQSVQDGRGLKEILSDIERTILAETLQRCGENQAAVAKKLKIPRQTLQNRLKKYGL
jgi:arginine utilization regulatory protein